MSRPSPLAKLRTLVKSIPVDVEKAVGQDVHLYGLRGILVLSSFFWMFFYTFIPHLVSGDTGGPVYQKTLRMVLSPLLWNGSLISSFFFILSARSICVRFLKNPTPTTYAGSVIRRNIRIPLAVGLASAIASGIFRAIGTKYIDEFKQLLPNDSITPPTVAKDGLVVVNAMYNLFWVVRSYYYQAANSLWPSQTIWNVSVIYQQSWTVYFLMVILPYTRPTWHLPALSLFALGSFWLCSWGWYDATALLLADYTINPKLRQRLSDGLKVFREEWTVPFAVPACLMVAIGAAMKYTWTAFPRYINKELLLHPYIELTPRLTAANFALADPYPRVDDYLVIVGILLLVDSTTQLRQQLSAKWLVGLGKRSFSVFVAQSLINWTVGIKLFLYLRGALGKTTALANLAVFFTCLPAIVVSAELYYRLIDRPSAWIAGMAYSWLTH